MSKEINDLLDLKTIRVLTRLFDIAEKQLYLVGGSVRDLFSVGGYDDLDFTTDARPDEIISIVDHLGTVWDAGKNYGTIGVDVDGQKVEITTFRSDKYDGATRNPEVVFGDNILVDLKRRDFTINAMAIDLRKGSLVDPFNGREDLAKRIIRTPADPYRTIQDDPLRSLRALRFSATRDFEIDTELSRAIVLYSNKLSMVSQERKTAELKKIAIHGSGALRNAVKRSIAMGLRRHLFGNLTLEPSSAITPWYRESAIFAIAFISSKTSLVEIALSDMKFSTEEIRAISAVHKIVRFLRSDQFRLELRRVIRKESDATINAAVAIMRCFYSTVSIHNFLQEFKSASVWRAKLQVNGDDFVKAGFSGKAIGVALASIENEILRGEVMSQYDQMICGSIAAERFLNE